MHTLTMKDSFEIKCKNNEWHGNNRQYYCTRQKQLRSFVTVSDRASSWSCFHLCLIFRRNVLCNWGWKQNNCRAITRVWPIEYGINPIKNLLCFKRMKMKGEKLVSTWCSRQGGLVKCMDLSLREVLIKYMESDLITIWKYPYTGTSEKFRYK